jgi:hypothetical protein
MATPPSASIQSKQSEAQAETDPHSVISPKLNYESSIPQVEAGPPPPASSIPGRATMKSLEAEPNHGSSTAQVEAESHSLVSPLLAVSTTSPVNPTEPEFRRDSEIPWAESEAHSSVSPITGFTQVLASSREPDSTHDSNMFQASQTMDEQHQQPRRIAGTENRSMPTVSVPAVSLQLSTTTEPIYEITPNSQRPSGPFQSPPPAVHRHPLTVMKDKG